MIVTVTPAPAVDRTQRVARLDLGESLRVETPDERPGGKGLNVARVASARGVPVTVVGPLGGGSGDRVAQALDQVAAQVLTRWIRVAAPTRTSTALVEDDGRVTVLNEIAGALTPDEHAALRHAAVAAARQAEAPVVVAVCGSWPRDTPPGTLHALVAELHDVGATVLVDTSGEWLLEAARAGADVLKPNVHELAEATGTDGVDAGLATLFALGAREVLLSRGEDGMSHHTQADIGGVSARLNRVLTGNPTGAGDAAVAGWLSRIERLGHSPATFEERRSALVAAVSCSAAAVMAPVAGELGVDPRTLEPDVIVAAHPSAP